MNLYPAEPDFAATYDAGRPQVVWTRQPADLDTTASVMLKIGQDTPFSAVLESVEGGAVRGRYSTIALQPDVIWRCNGQTAEFCRKTEDKPLKYAADTRPTMESLRAFLEETKFDLPSNLPPMSAGLIGYMGYDTIRLVENIPAGNRDTVNIPDGMFMRPSLWVIFDNVDDVMTIVTPVYPKPGVDAGSAFGDARKRILDLIATLDRPIPRNEIATPANFGEVRSNIGREGYHAMVRKAKEYVFAGDIFQVVPSQRLRMPFSLPSFALYRSLRRLNPSPFLFHLAFDGFALVGSSPEILVRVRDGKVTIRPIAGTRPRGETRAEDEQLAADLLADPKEVAEHLMLLDLGRNDVGRVSKVGTVRVTEQMVIEYYSHVMHIVSNVEGEIDPKYDALSALMAGFPAGTVSGAPKVRAMEIIEELETEKRSFYGGAIGYFSANGDMDTCIALRTSCVKDGEVIVQAGGGIVADSDPESEFQESNNKAKALIRAAEEAIKYATRGNR